LTTKQHPHSWAVYHRTPAQFVGIVYDAPDEKTARISEAGLSLSDGTEPMPELGVT
jgi:hypothetical protein